MSNELEHALEAVNKYEIMTNKLTQIKAIGHTACIRSLNAYTNVRLKELGLVTSSYTKTLDLFYPSGNHRVLWHIITRNLRSRIPYLSPVESEFLKVRNDYISIRPSISPKVERYLRVMSKKLAENTHDSYSLRQSYDYDIDRAVWLLEANTSSRIYNFKIIEVAEGIIQALITLHREIVMRKGAIEDGLLLVSLTATTAPSLGEPIASSPAPTPIFIRSDAF